jgi:hypothetical protein
MFQNILGKPALLIKLIQERPDVEGHVNKAEVAELFKNVSGLYYGLYVTSWTEYGMYSTYQAAVKASTETTRTANAFSAAASTAANRARAAATAVRSIPRRFTSWWTGSGGEGEEFFDPENIDEQRSQFIQESFSIIMATIEFMNIFHATPIGKDNATSGINDYKAEMTQLVLDFSTRVEAQSEAINDITKDILDKLEEINNRILHE